MTRPKEQVPLGSRVVVCVLTYRRPEGLARLLEALDRQVFLKSPPPDLRVLVVDNDASRSAEAVIAEGRARLRVPVEYLVEPRQGIPFARNTAVRHVEAAADFLAFIDDDEVPAPTWMDELLYARACYQADVVSGPVVPCFDDPPPSWVIRGGFFERERLPSGSILTVTRSGNVLIRTSLFGEMDELFDERLALTGGSDTHFFLRVWRAGFKIVWADEAVVTEHLSGGRLTLGYVLRRGFRTGNTRGLCERDFGRARGQRDVGAVRASWRVAKGVFLLPLSVFVGTHAVVHSARTALQGAGYLAGRVGVRFDGYRNPDGN